MYKLIWGDCELEMKAMEENSIDTIITDPPYGLKFMGKKWDYDVPSVETFKEMLRVVKPGATLLCFAGSRTQHRMACNIEDAGWILKDCIMWIYGSGFPKATDISKQLDKLNGKKQETTYVPNHKNNNYGKGMGGGQTCENQPATPEAKIWNGWKSHGLKPAYEPIIVAMKPNEGTYANNALKHGVSGLNIDGGRIGEENIVSHHTKMLSFDGQNSRLWHEKHVNTISENKGRYPANIILDEEAGKMLDDQSGITKSQGGENNEKYNDTAIFGNAKSEYKHYGDKGGASRFFYCAKSSKSERGESNSHPTVKPLKLMSYLVKITKTPTGGVVLDPFCGSGTTLIACKLEGREYIGIDKDWDYLEIAKKRLEEVKKDE